MICLYIAGPMSGLADFNFPAFEETKGRLEAVGYRVESPVDLTNDLGMGRSWERYMVADLAVIRSLRERFDEGRCGVATLPGWIASRGARLEVEQARISGIEVASVTEWLCRATEAVAT